MTLLGWRLLPVPFFLLSDEDEGLSLSGSRENLFAVVQSVSEVFPLAPPVSLRETPSPLSLLGW